MRFMATNFERSRDLIMRSVNEWLWLVLLLGVAEEQLSGRIVTVHVTEPQFVFQGDARTECFTDGRLTHRSTPAWAAASQATLHGSAAFRPQPRMDSVTSQANQGANSIHATMSSKNGAPA